MSHFGRDTSSQYLTLQPYLKYVSACTPKSTHTPGVLWGHGKWACAHHGLKFTPGSRFARTRIAIYFDIAACVMTFFKTLADGCVWQPWPNGLYSFIRPSHLQTSTPAHQTWYLQEGVRLLTGWSRTWILAVQVQGTWLLNLISIFGPPTSRNNNKVSQAWC